MASHERSKRARQKRAEHTCPLRLPRSEGRVERRAKADGISVNQFVATAVAEKLAVMNTAEFFAERVNRADFAAFERLLNRKSTEPTRGEDEVK